MTQESGAAEAKKPVSDNGNRSIASAHRQHHDVWTEATEAECRRRGDRRAGSWKSIVYGNFRPRRRGSRRLDDAHFIWFDWHEPRILYLALGILLLSCTDALFTLNLINAGADEANPMMASMLEIGIEAFVAAKITVTSLSVIVLVIAARRTFVGPLNVEHVLQTVFTGYLMLICYEIYMFWYVFDLSISPAWLRIWYVQNTI